MALTDIVKVVEGESKEGVLELKVVPKDENVKNTFVAYAKENGVSEKTIKEVDNLRLNFLEELTSLATKEGGNRLKNNSDIDEVSVMSLYGAREYDKATVRVIREVENINPTTKEKFKSPTIKVKTEFKSTKLTPKRMTELKQELKDILAG